MQARRKSGGGFELGGLSPPPRKGTTKAADESRAAFGVLGFEMMRQTAYTAARARTRADSAGVEQRQLLAL